MSSPVSEKTKSLLVKAEYRIQLDDLIVGLVKKTIENLSPVHFPSSPPFSLDEFQQRLGRYQTITSDLRAALILLCYWGEKHHLPHFAKALDRLAEVDRGSSGDTRWLNLGWFPVYTLAYSCGISAIAAQNYDFLFTLLTHDVVPKGRSAVTGNRSLVVNASYAMAEMTTTFKLLPGFESKHLPLSEYLFENIRAQIDEELFLGNSYEPLFDRFEIFFCLTCADLLNRAGNNAWGMPGRFFYRSRRADGPLSTFLEEASKAGDQWKPLEAGFFQKSQARLSSVAVEVQKWIRDTAFF